MYNPFDPVEITVNGQNMYTRPIEFDSEIANHKDSTNAFGFPVKPSKLSATCPDCGAGLEFDVILSDPPFEIIHCKCYYCYPDQEPVPDPFTNPVETGRVPETELDPLLYDPNIEQDTGSVAERLSEDESETISEELVNILDEGETPKEATEDTGSCAEKEKTSEAVSDESAKESKGEAKEAQFDDAELVEPE